MIAIYRRGDGDLDTFFLGDRDADRLRLCLLLTNTQARSSSDIKFDSFHPQCCKDTDSLISNTLLSSPVDAARPPGTAVALGGRLRPFFRLLLLPPVPDQNSKARFSVWLLKTEAQLSGRPPGPAATASIPGMGPPPPRALGPPATL